MNKFLLLTSLVLSMNSMAGGYDYLCEGTLSTGAKISFDRQIFTKVSPSKDKSPGKVTAMRIDEEGSLFPKDHFQFSGFDDQKAVLNVTKVISDTSYDEGGEPCEGGYTLGVYGSSKILEATYEDFETQKQTINVVCVDQGMYSGSCDYRE